MNLRQSIFQAREMLLDYEEKRLDQQRQDLVQRALQNDSETQRTLNNIRKGLELAQEFSKIQIEDDFNQYLQISENFSSTLKKYSHFKNWAPNYRMAGYIFGIFCSIGLAIYLVPADVISKLKVRPQDEIVLSVVKNDSNPSKLSDDPETRDAQLLAAQNMDSDDENDSDNASSEESSGDEGIVAANTNENQNEDNTPNSNLRSKTPEPKVQAQNEQAKAVTNLSDKKQEGYVYRGTMRISDLDENSKLITEHIKSLGGEKAGEVDLGWRKDNKGSYYHFTIPESHFDNLQEFLHKMYPVKFSKDPHPRIMPDGQIRIILWVERVQ